MAALIIPQFNWTHVTQQGPKTQQEFAYSGTICIVSMQEETGIGKRHPPIHTGAVDMLQRLNKKQRAALKGWWGFGLQHASFSIRKSKTTGLLFGQTKLRILITMLQARTLAESIALPYSPVLNLHHPSRTVRLVVFSKEKNKAVAYSPVARLYQI